MNSRRLWRSFIVLKTLYHFLLFLFGISLSPLIAEDDAPALVEIAIAVMSNELMTELELTGTIVSQRRSSLSSRAEGLVDEILVDAGSQVEKGDVLLTLDTKVAELELALIHALIETAQVQLEDAEREREEVKGLTDSGAFAKTEAASRETNVKIREAELKALKVREEQQMEQLDRHRLVAPFSGTIVRRTAESGEWVETGMMAFELIETEAASLWFDIQVAQELLASIRGVEEATIVLDAFPNQSLTATIDVMIPVKDRVSRTFLTRLTFQDAEGIAAPGMSGKAVLKVRPDQTNHVSIPRDAVTRYPDGTAKVWVVREESGNQVAHSVEVRTGSGLGETIEVVEGLKGGEKVVVRGNEGLSEGQAVTTRDASNPKAASL